jgi:hypothetical protein
MNKVAKFNEKVTLVTTLNKIADSNVNSNGPIYAHKLVHLKLFANYNGKDKAIGVISFDLALYTAKNMDKT